MANDPQDKPVPLAALAAVFLKLGTIAFGGPAAHIAMMEDEFVRKRRWISAEEFLDRLAAANLIPGPSSTELAIFIGYSKRGVLGLLVAGTCFIVPAAVLVSLIAALYVRYGAMPQVANILFFIKPVVIAIVAQALWNLGRTGIKTKFLAFVAAVSLGLCLLNLDPLLILLGAGTIATAPLWRRKRASALLAPASWLGLGGAAGAAAPVTVLGLFLSFLKIGAVVFGSGYVLLAFLRAEFITKMHWLTEKQLIDAVAVGQLTPGPVFTTATFIGYILAGIPGAFFATLGIFLPGFLLVAVSGPLVPKLRRSVLASAMLDGVVVGSLALMAAVTWHLGRSAIVSWPTALIAVAALTILLRFKISPAWLIAGAALLGWMVKI